MVTLVFYILFQIEDSTIDNKEIPEGTGKVINIGVVVIIKVFIK